MNIDKITIHGTSYDIKDVTSTYSQIEISNLLSSGVAIGTITLNGTSYIIYAPNNSSASGFQVIASGNELMLTNL